MRPHELTKLSRNDRKTAEKCQQEICRCGYMLAVTQFYMVFVQMCIMHILFAFLNLRQDVLRSDLFVG